MSEKRILCNICSSDISPLARGVILNKYDIQYYSCENCGFIQTEYPYWLDEAYSSAIARSDIGLIGRNIKYSRLCAILISLLARRDDKFLDYGAGNGMFVRMMRDLGFDFFWQDKYATNQFAEGFEALQNERFSLLTAFEVFEHMPQPVEIIENMFNYSDTIFFSTRLIPRWKIKPDDWWYFTLDTGQHVSLFTRESLEFIARKFNVRLSSNGISFHVFSSQTVPEFVLKALSFHPFATFLSGLLNLGHESLLEEDYDRLTGRRFDQ